MIQSSPAVSQPVLVTGSPECDFPEMSEVGFNNLYSLVSKQKKEILLQNVLGLSFSGVKMLTFNLTLLDLILK